MRNQPNIHYLRHAASAYRLQMTLNILLGVMDVCIGLVEVWLSKQLIDAATSGHSWSLADGGWLSLPALAAMLIACMLTSIALAYAVRWLRAQLSVRSLNRLQAGEYARLLQSPWLYLRKQHSGTLTNTLVEDIDTVSAFLSEQFPALITAVLQFIGAFAFLPEREPYESLACAVFLLLIAGAVFSFIYGGMQEDKYKVWKYNRDNNPAPEAKRRLGLIGALCGGIMLTATAVYVGLGLTRNTWGTAWWLFAVGGILCGVVSVVLDPYKGEDE